MGWRRRRRLRHCSWLMGVFLRLKTARFCLSKGTPGARSAARLAREPLPLGGAEEGEAAGADAGACSLG